MSDRAKEKDLKKIMPGMMRIGRRFLPYIRKRQLLIAGSFLALLVETGFRLLEPWSLKFVFDHVLVTETNNDSLKVIVSHGIDPMLLLALLALSIVVISVLGSFAAYLSTFGMALASVQILTDIRSDLYSHLQRLSLTFHMQHKSGDLITRVTADIDRIKLTIVKVILPLVTNIVALVGMLVVMSWMNWELSAIALTIFPLFYFSMTRLIGRIRHVSREHRKFQGILAATTSETIGAIEVVQALSLHNQLEDIFEQQNNITLNHGAKSLKLLAVLQRTVQILIALTIALVLWRGSHLVIQKTLTPGDLLVFITYLKNAFEPIRKLSNQFSEIAKATASGERIIDVLDYEPHVRNLPRAKPAHPFFGAVRFENVTFAYESGKAILQNISFEAQPGQKVAVVGASGGGKSTLISLILRLYDPNSGRILIDGQDLGEYTLDSLRQQIGVVLQESILFAASIRENIAYGKLGATDAEIEQAAKIANAHDFIMNLPDGYETVLGERGCTLSGGQRQRIAIARAAIRKAPIVILDEPTTGLDNASEQAVNKALNRLTQGRTTFLISHNK
ncbi:ABC-type multidrug transport system, ATPase and permease component [Pleurocapsa sp. PCC 7327]|uniref:ABC transporter ATP-binding protein n=1 Tax=Pleurocapsa sp. PCC 7327 TaxID=118163 RepID=UPI00029FE65E|nr:ABC transporter ATP-binding protein [Pleurocapsa sp. PCC 7327]AFY77270.1 ABC-type multidrug transport system, ATPase and permease component [Pleurocapsa sp. PCC 7327]